MTSNFLPILSSFHFSPKAFLVSRTREKDHRQKRVPVTGHDHQAAPQRREKEKR
ncbi:hypothetical protein HanRHA438_Chr17g0835761 [Helianthus annuus]|uniref:Uncharacterized protein n=1 Tax=Helianthus annuus TaxID=4232 RepID=A0A9K3DKS0_HELAN|nr:hypothetical protein HanXRQr2_Chr17g0825521 [Helianthus annuus]KAJ0828310.1 hypothetical protein HanRHA438_Chr17g0835761 [Helianthus annuus]